MPPAARRSARAPLRAELRATLTVSALVSVAVAEDLDRADRAATSPRATQRLRIDHAAGREALELAER